jgi:hypothetical protein
MPFGGRPCPSIWSDVSETIPDLSSSLAADPTWDPVTLHSPLQHLIPATVSEPDDVPFAVVLPVTLDIPTEDREDYKADIFIDDVISVMLDDRAVCAKGAAALLLTIHTVSCPVADLEPVQQNELTVDK